MNQQTLITDLSDLLKGFDAIQAAWLMGSYGRGDQDEFSDIDIAAYIPDKKTAQEIFQQIVDTISKRPDIVYHKTLPWGGTVNAVTKDWLRFDISVLHQDKLQDYTQKEAKFLFDKGNIISRLPLDYPIMPIEKIKADIKGITDEFIRILGLQPIALGREDYVIATYGIQILKDMLIKLIKLENPPYPMRGALSLKKAIPREDYRKLAEVPVIHPTRDSLIEANCIIAGLFLPKAKQLYKKHHMAWPDRFELAAIEHLKLKCKILDVDILTD